MCFAVRKIPQGKILENGKLIEHPQYVAMKQYEKEVEQSQRNPLSVGKQRNRAK